MYMNIISVLQSHVNDERMFAPIAGSRIRSRSAHSLSKHFSGNILDAFDIRYNVSVLDDKENIVAYGNYTALDDNGGRIPIEEVPCLEERRRLGMEIEK